jgi:hypothetical protein
MGWLDYHSWEFEANKQKYGMLVRRDWNETGKLAARREDCAPVAGKSTQPAGAEPPGADALSQDQSQSDGHQAAVRRLVPGLTSRPVALGALADWDLRLFSKEIIKMGRQARAVVDNCAVNRP